MVSTRKPSWVYRVRAAAFAGALLILLSLAHPVRSISTPIRLASAGYTPELWLPDGSALIVGRPGRMVPLADGKALQRQELWLVPLDGSPARRLTDNGVQPRLTEDGRHVTFLSHRQGDTWQEMTLSLASGEVQEGKSMRWGELDLHTAAAPLWDIPAPAGEHRLQVEVDAGPSAALWLVGPEGRRPLFQGERWFLSRPSWHPDGRRFAYARIPPGTGEIGDIFLVDAATGKEEWLTAGQHPIWSPDGSRLAFWRPDGVWMWSWGAGASVMLSTLPPVENPAESDVRSAGQLTPPAVIRVKHNPANYYRSNVPPGQVDIFPFEEYVKRVVPYEMPVSWPAEALKSQAVSARTYAWWFVLRRTSWDFDVTDWTEYQVMGPNTYPASNAAVEATTGQYLAYRENVILAEYSAQNGSPTLPRGSVSSPDPNFPYLRSVDDPVCFGEVRNGHGRGMSQVGSRRWAAWYGWNYAQILLHYYTGVTLELPANASPSPALPVGAVVEPWHGFHTNADRILLRVNTSDADGDAAGVDLAARLRDAEGNPVEYPLGMAVPAGSGWYYLWDIASLPDQPLAAGGVSISGTAWDAAGRQSALGTLTFGIDRQAPAGLVTAPAQAFTTTIPLTVSLSAPDAGGSIGILLSNGWIWEGESLYHESGTGIVVSDSAAWNGQAWLGRAGVDRAGAWFGPYTKALPAFRAYRALFRLKTDAITDTRPIAVLDVVDNAGATLLGIRPVRGIDFRQAGVYQEFAVDFWYPQPGSSSPGTSGLEFRVAFAGIADLYFDRVMITGYPIAVTYPQSTVSWELPPAAGTYRLYARLTDAAGNLSPDQPLTVTLTFPIPTPTPTRTPTPTATSSPIPTPTPTATPAAGQVALSFTVQALFGDVNGNGAWDEGEPALEDARMWFMEQGGGLVVAPARGGSWHFTASLPAGRRYCFVALAAGFGPRSECFTAQPAGAVLTINWPAVGLPAGARALLPQVQRLGP